MRIFFNKVCLIKLENKIFFEDVQDKPGFWFTRKIDEPGPNIVQTHSSFHSAFQKLMEMGDLKTFAGKKVERQNGGEGVFRNGGLPYYIQVFLEITHTAALGKIDAFPLLKKHVLQNSSSNKIWHDGQCNGLPGVDKVILAVLVIHAYKKNYVWYFYPFSNANKPPLFVNDTWNKYLINRFGHKAWQQQV